MEEFTFLEFDHYPNATNKYKGWWKMISSRCLAAPWTEVLKIVLPSSISAALQLEPQRNRVRNIHLPHTRLRYQGENPMRLPWKFRFIIDVLLVIQRKPRTTETPSEIPSPPTNVGDSPIEILHIIMENLTKSQLTKEAMTSPHEILDALKKILHKTLEVANEKLGEINVVTEQLMELESAFHDIKGGQMSDIKAQILELVKELKATGASSEWSSSCVRELTNVCIKFDELSIGKFHLIDDKEEAQEIYEGIITGWAELVK
ncbi:hypothetical protein M9H77_07993 [Catharanthus roseus]|uniref:Uncharacterized protein n=1 Tax=Catharanthus roseus TaxID=4058 RepID=A0ACC0BWU1_CATRO|nr:hypothetical protein M9H77_07993 [Catharanthus roseus]